MIQQKKFLPFSRLDGHLSHNCCFTWGFLNTQPLHCRRWLTVAHFSACVWHMFWKLWLSVSLRLDRICVGVLKCCTHCLFLNFVFIVVTSDALTSLKAFHFHLCVSTFTPTGVIVNVSYLSAWDKQLVGAQAPSQLSPLLQSSLLPSSGSEVCLWETDWAQTVGPKLTWPSSPQLQCFSLETMGHSLSRGPWQWGIRT